MLLALLLALENKRQKEAVRRRVLFLCTKNSARSQMAEALLRTISHGTIEVVSAGSDPAEAVHPFTLHLMEQLGIPMHQAAPKHLNHFRGQHFDAVIILCDQEHEVCPAFPWDRPPAHWAFPDPTQVAGSEAERSRVFEQTSLHLAMRIRLLLTLLERR